MKLSARIIIGLLAIAAGVLLVVCNKTITSHGILTVAGILFILAGVLDGALTAAVRRRLRPQPQPQPDTAKPQLQPRRTRITAFAAAVRLTVSLAAIALGIAVLVTPLTFAPAIPVVFAIVILLGALMVYYTLALGLRQLWVPGWLYILPTLIVVAAVLIFIQRSPDDDAAVMIFSGIGVGLYGLSELLIGITAKEIEDDDQKRPLQAADDEPAQ